MPEPILEIAPRRGPRGSTKGAVAFALGCCIFLVGGLLYVAAFGVPGAGGGVSDQPQQTSSPSAQSAPNVDVRFGNGGTRETQGYGPPPRRE